jgi:hypothetical protein
LGFALQHGCPFLDLPRCHNINDFHRYKITASQFTTDGHIEQGEVAMVLGQLKPHTDCPDMLDFNGSF